MTGSVARPRRPVDKVTRVAIKIDNGAVDQKLLEKKEALSPY